MSYHAKASSDSRQSVLQQSIRTAIRRTGTTIGLLGLPGIALAGPEGGDVVRGTADIITPDANTTTINQLTDRAVINWQTFNVGADEFVIFNQLDSSSVVLNRVLSSDASRIFGDISANGHVFLLNPHGIFFGEGATLDVQGFLGSTLDITDDDFMAGNYNFTRADNGAALGTVANAGTITAGEGGYVLLAGDVAENTGLITARGGTAALISGNALTLDLEGDGLVNFAVNEATLAGEAGVRNAGSIIADGGMVVMTARVANEVTSTVVNNEGTVRARAIENRGGEIWLVGHGGDVEQSGSLDASGENGDGGQMMVWGDNDVTLHDGGVQTVDGAEGHDAGDARFIAQEHLDYQANNLISADGEIGGTVEVSGHGGLNLAGNPVIGPNGELIIDPQHIAITRFSGAPASPTTTYTWAGGLTPGFYDAGEDVTALGRGWIEDQLGFGVNVTLVASETITYDATIDSTLAQAGTAVGDLALYIGSVDSLGGATDFSLGLNGGVFNGVPTISTSLDPDAGQINISGLTINTANVNYTASIVGGGAGDSIILPNITANNITVNAGSAAVSGIGSFGAASLNAGNNISITGGTIQNFYVATAQNATFNGDIAGSNFYAGTSTGSPGVRSITVNGSINVTNQIWLNASSGITVTGNAIAQGGSLFMRTAPFSNSAGDITIAGYASAGLAINLSATGPATNGTGGNISIGSGMFAGGNISLNVDGAGASSGGNISVGDVSGASVNLTASDGSGGGGNINAGNISGDTINLTTWGNTSFAGRGNMIVGNINATGAVTIDGNYGNSYNIGDITGSNVTANFRTDIGGTIGVSLGSISADNNAIVSINKNPDGSNSTGTLDITNITTVSGLVNLGVLDTALNANGLLAITNGINAGGDVIIHDGGNEKDVSIGAGGISGNNIQINASGRNVTLNGDINATGSVNILSGQLNITGQDIIATGNADIYASNSTGTLSFGNIAGSRILLSGGGANIVTGSLDASNATGFSEINIDATDFIAPDGNITVNGNITITAGGVISNSGMGANLELVTGTSGGNTITVNGTTTIQATAGPFLNMDTSVNGTWGAVQVSANAGNGAVTMGDINVTGAGEGRVDINAATISLGDIGMDIAGGNMNGLTGNPENCNSTGCSGTVDRTITDGGRGIVSLNNDPVINPGATATFGNVTITAPEVEFRTYGQVSVTGGSIALTATGGTYDRVSSGTYSISGGGSWSLNETHVGAGARLDMQTTASGSVVLGGNVSATGQGYADVQIIADTIDVNDVSASVSGGTFTRSGTSNPFASEEDGPFNRDGGGPRIDEGTINGGTATIQLMDHTSGGSPVAATSVTAGNLSVNAVGSARIEILSQTVNAGNITGTATLATRNGTINNTFSSGGSTIQESGTVSGSFGDVDVVIENGATAGNVTLGNVTLNGPVAGGHIDGANVTMGDFSLTGTGINLDVNETRTNVTTGTSETLVFQGEALITGMGLTAGNSLQVGSVNVSGVGAAGTLLSGVNVQTGNVTINVTDANVTAQDASYFGGALTSFTVGNAVFGIDATSAAVNGNLDVTATGIAHIGGTFDVTGDAIINAGRGYDPVIAEEVQFLDSVDNDGSGGSLALSGPMDVSATNITFVSGSSLDLTPATLVATGNMTLAANGDLNANTASFGGHLDASATGAINLAGIGTGGASLNIDAGSSINVGSGISVSNAANLRASGGGAGSIDVAGGISASSVNIVTAGSGGRVQIGTSTSGFFTGGDITATAGMINIDVFSSTVGGGHFYAGALNAAGDLGINVNGQSGTDAGIIRLGNADSTGALTTAAAATAGGNVFIDVIAASTGGTIAASGISAGNNLTINNNVLGALDASGVNLVAGGIIGITGNATQLFGNMDADGINVYTNIGDIVTGSLTASNATGMAFVDLETQDASTGTINVGGGITVSGTATSNNPVAANVQLIAPAFIGTGSVSVSGPISITGAAASYSVSQQGGSETGFVGEANLRVDTGSNGNVTLGSVNLDGVGRGAVDIGGVNVSIGNITANIASGNFSQAYTTSCGGTCNLTVANSITSGGFFDVTIGNFGTAGSTLTLGDINITAPGAMVQVGQFQSITGGLVNLAATGYDASITSSGTFEGSAVNYNQTATNAGSAALRVEAGSTASVSFGAVTLDGAGSANLEILGDSITVGAIALSASGGTFTISGSPAFGSDHNFGERTPGPRIDQGTITGGMTDVHLAGFGTGTGSVAASQVDVLGSISAVAPGLASVEIMANSINVSGNITASATANLVKNGIIDNTYFDSAVGASFQSSGTVFSSLGAANVDLEGSTAGTVTASNISIAGGQAGGTIKGGTLSIGNVSVTVTGGSIDVTETVTNLSTGTSETMEFQGPALINGARIAATGTVTMGSLNVSGVGAGGALIEGSSVSMGSVNIAFTDANYTVLDPDVFGSTATTFTLGDAIFDLDAATASINGNLAVSGTQAARVGGNLNATGTINISGGNGVFNSISQEVNYLNRLDNDGSGSDIVLASPITATATSATLSASSGSLDLGNATVTTTTGDLTLSAANAVLAGNASLTVAGSTIVNAASLTVGGNSTTSYNLVTNVGGITLADAASVTIDNTANTGTTTLNQGGTVGTLSVVDGGTLTLGTALNAGDISLSANAISLGTNSISASNSLNLAGSTVALDGNAISAGLVDISATGSITGMANVTGDAITISTPTVTGDNIVLTAATLAMGTGSVTAATGINLDIGSSATVANTLFAAPVVSLSGTATTTLSVQTETAQIDIGSLSSVSVDNTANTGTTTLNQGGTVGTLSVVDGGTLTLGTALNAGSIALDASDIAIGSNAITAAGALTLVSANDVSGSGVLTAGNIAIDASNATALDLLTNTANLSINGAGALAIDNTAFTGAAAMNLNGGSYDSVDANLGGDATLVGGFNAGSVNLNVGGSLDLSSTVIAITNDATVAAGSDIKLTNIDLTTGGNLVVTAGGDIFNAQPPGTITADALSMTAGGSINLPNITFNIGSGSLAGVNGDTELVDLLRDDELAPTSATPNAYFEGNNVSLGTINMSGDYLYIVSNSLSVTGFTGANDTLIQLVAKDPSAGIGVEDLPASTSTVNYSNSETFAAFAGHTIAVGSTTSTGDILIGENGTLDVGSTNFFAITRGNVTGLDNVLSTGIVKDLDELLGIGFEIPQTDEIDVEQDTSSDLNDDFGHNAGDDLEDNLEEDEEEGDEEGEDTDDEIVDEEDDDSLISQDTVEEELMCES